MRPARLDARSSTASLPCVASSLDRSSDESAAVWRGFFSMSCCSRMAAIIFSPPGSRLSPVTVGGRECELPDLADSCRRPARPPFACRLPGVRANSQFRPVADRHGRQLRDVIFVQREVPCDGQPILVLARRPPRDIRREMRPRLEHWRQSRLSLSVDACVQQRLREREPEPSA